MQEMKVMIKYYYMAISRKMIYRTAFFLSIISSIAHYLLLLVFFAYIYRNRSSIAGFTFPEIICIQGMSIVLRSLFITIFGHGAPNFAREVIDGRIELYMTKPVNWRVLPLIKHASFTHIFHGLFGIFLVWVSIHKAGIAPGILQSFLTFLSIIAGAVSILLFQLILSAISLKVRLFTLPWIYWDITEFSSYPYKLIPKWLFFLLTIVPVVSLSAFPEGILMRGWSYKALLIQVAVLFSLYSIQKVLWKKMEMLYEGSGTIR